MNFLLVFFLMVPSIYRQIFSDLFGRISWRGVLSEIVTRRGISWDKEKIEVLNLVRNTTSKAISN